MNDEFRQPREDSNLQLDLPERKLMLAILEDAVATFRRGLGRSSCVEIQAFREVDRWFRSEESDWPFSFECICSTLEIDAGYVRHGLNVIREAAFVERQGDDRTASPASAERLLPHQHRENPPDHGTVRHAEFGLRRPRPVHAKRILRQRIAGGGVRATA